MKFLKWMVLLTILGVAGYVFFMKQVPEQTEIVAMWDTCLRSSEGQEEFRNEFEKITGVRLTINQPAHSQYRDKMLFSFAADQQGDVVEIMPDYFQDYYALAKRGDIVPLDKYIAKSKVFENITQAYLDAVRIDGKIYGVPINTGGGVVTYLRKDWLDNLGLEMPRNWDEYYHVLKAFTYGDPDKNGKDDTFGITLPGLRESIYLQDFYQGAEHGFIQRNGVWVDGLTEPIMKEALTRLQQAYKDKLIDLSIFTNKTSNCREKFYRGECGVFPYWAGNWANNLQRNLETNYSEADVVALPAIEGVAYVNRIGPLMAVTNKAVNPEQVFKNIIELMNDGGAGQNLFINGVEDHHWTKEAGKYNKIPYGSSQTIISKAYVQPELALNESFLNHFELDLKVKESLKAFESCLTWSTLPPNSPTYLQYGEAISNLKTEIMTKIILGETSVEAGLVEYEKRSKVFQVDKILREVNQKPDDLD